jgi:hypothetical protein
MCSQVPEPTAAMAAMSYKIFLPMGEKPPEEFSLGSYTFQFQHTTAIPFHLPKWVQEDFLALVLLTPRATASLFIVIFGTLKNNTNKCHSMITHLPPVGWTPSTFYTLAPYPTTSPLAATSNTTISPNASISVFHNCSTMNLRQTSSVFLPPPKIQMSQQNSSTTINNTTCTSSTSSATTITNMAKNVKNITMSHLLVKAAALPLQILQRFSSPSKGSSGSIFL